MKDYQAVSTIHQDIHTPHDEFGRIRDTLLPGNYIFRFLAYTDVLAFDDSNGSLRGFGHIMGENEILHPIGDIFVASMAYAVSPDSPVVVHPLSLERVVGKLVLQITDAREIRLKNLNIDVFVAPTWPFFYWDGGTMPNVRPYNSIVPQTGVRTFEAFLFPSTDPKYQVWINVRRQNTGEVVLAKAVPYVQIVANRKTILTGSLFGPTAWELIVKDEWDDDIEMEF